MPVPEKTIRRISADEVRKVARLAHLEADAAEVERFTRQLGDVLDHMASLEAIDVSGVPPTSHPIPLAAPERDDRAVPSLPRDEALAGASETEDGCFRVPKVVESD